MKSLITLIASVLVTVMATGCATKCIYPITPLPESMLTGSWFGYTSGDVELWRLTLLRNGTGAIASVYSTNAPILWRISEWKSDCQHITFKIVSQQEAEELVLSSEIIGNKIGVQIIRHHGSRSVLMSREDTFLDKLESLRNVMSDHGEKDK